MDDPRIKKIEARLDGIEKTLTKITARLSKLPDPAREQVVKAQQETRKHLRR
jgi:hypothetical protein